MKAIKLLKIVVSGLQHWGIAVINIPGVISIMNHTTLEVTKLYRSLPI